MTGLKRKRGKDSDPRKAPKLVDDVSPNVSNGEDMEGSHAGDDSVDLEVDINAEEEEWAGLSMDANALDLNEARTHEAGTKPKKPPTGEELRVIKDATDLFRSSSFKLQIDALLPNVRPKTSRTPPLDRFLLALHAFLMALPSVSPQHPLEAARRLLKKNVSVPYSLPLPAEDTNWKVGFEKPNDITVVGSWANKVSVKAKDGISFGVDIAVEMPDSLFQEKDYLNGRFFHKRAFYLATVAAAIKSSKSGLHVDVLYDSQSDDPRLTKLVLLPQKNDTQTDFTRLNARVCIIPVLSSQAPIALQRLSPLHSNIRINLTTGEDTKTSNLPTPIYNTALLLALLPKHQLLTTHTFQAESPAFSDALTLLRVWANQRGYGAGSKMCVHGFDSRGSWWGALLGLLIAGEERAGAPKSSKRKPLGRGLSSYQLFRAALDFLSKHDFEKDSVFMRTKDGHRYPSEEYKQSHEAVFVDSSSTANLLAGVSLNSLATLRHDALKTLETLDQASISSDPFTDVFLTDHRDLATRFDTVLRVDLSSASPLNPSIQLTMDTGSPANALMTSLSSKLRQGLDNRTKAVTILHTPSLPRSLSQAHPSNPEIIYIGLIHDPDNAFRIVDHGPAADEEDQSVIQQFREFWGEKAELRRFKDGRIVESIVWDVKTADERAHIPGMIVRHILGRHFGVEADKVQTWQTSFDSVLRLPETVSSMYLGAGVATGFKGAIMAFDNLVKQIKALDDDLPLSLLNVSPTSEQLRYTSVFSPVPLPPSLASSMNPNARYLGPIDIILEFEKSSKWPDDLKAIQKIKLAFFERLATVLMTSVDGLRANVVIGDGVATSEILDQACVEIVTPEGWAFSARIWHDREATLLDRIIDNKNKIVPHAVQNGDDKQRGKEYREAVEAKEVYTRRFIHAPRHHRAVAALSHQYSAYAGTVRLVKRWLASHWLLQGHISEEAVEVLCASPFVGDGRYVGADPESKQDGRACIPGSKERGFAVVIFLLKEWKWEEGLFIPLYGNDLHTPADESTGPRNSNVSVWNISTELDKGGHIWTSGGPDLIVAKRVHSLAKATWEMLQGMEHNQLDVKSMFIHPTDDYDFIIRLDPTLLPRYFHNVAVDTSLLSRRGKYANLPEEGSGVRPGFDPARLLLSDLQRVYAHTFKIFYDPFGGDRLGAVWDPTLKEPRPFRVLGEFSSLPVKKENEKAKDKGLVTLNQDSVLSEIERLGSGFIKDITVQV